MLEKFTPQMPIDSKPPPRVPIEDFVRRYIERANQLDHIPDSTPIVHQEDFSRLVLQRKDDLGEMKSVDPHDICFAEQDLQGFHWEHHGNTRESYQNLINSYQKVEKLKASGMTLEEIRHESSWLNKAVSSGFEPKGVPTVYRWQEKFIWADNGRHRVMMAQEMNLKKMNVLVKGSYIENDITAQMKE